MAATKGTDFKIFNKVTGETLFPIDAALKGKMHKIVEDVTENYSNKLFSSAGTVSLEPGSVDQLIEMVNSLPKPNDDRFYVVDNGPWPDEIIGLTVENGTHYICSEKNFDLMKATIQGQQQSNPFSLPCRFLGMPILYISAKQAEAMVMKAIKKA